MSGKIVTVSQQKGGSGKTTLAAHLAVALSPGLKVAILDVDPQGSLGEWYERRERTLGEQATGLRFTTASGWGAKREARALARDYDVVVVDTPPKADSDTRYSLEEATLVVVPIQPSPLDLWATRATLEMAAKEGRPALLVLNRVPPRTSLTAEMTDAIAQFGATLAEPRLGNRVAFAASMGSGLTVLESDRGSKAAAEAYAVAKDVWGRLLV
ncbi:ParA family partition ATPase [Prosthecomicrobium sp. N25]|uniref:ParA family partition ATPase n=1 Tax=Prosthecomicrobium sp. N25 TaxID=3129254 RepID=UPI0030774D30